MTYDTGLSMEERVTSLFQPDTLLPEQYMETFRRKLHLEPEKKLLLAVLEDAIACYQKYVFARDGKGKMLFTEAEEWFSEKGTDWLFSFSNVCEALGFNPDYLRQGLFQWKARELKARGKSNVYPLRQRKAKASRRRFAMPARRRQRMRKAAH
jgi:hypothetical protein